ncbi:MAG TPA: NAD(P)-binding domain-containing protein, partial [Dehalococcoidia bacterium]|nr:NAD(P)-binding domain-containing protein [Dehalococcoidia bacterium]
LSACERAERSLPAMQVGQIGLGAAGLAIARSVMAYTGRTVLGADRDPSALRRLESVGGVAAEGVEEILARCDVVIATTGQANLIRPEWIRDGQFIFALSNPRPEIDAAQALEAGAAVAASGRRVNNLMVYPGVCRGLLDVRARAAPLEVFQAASEALVAVTPSDALLPDALDRAVHRRVSRAVARAAIAAGVARREPDPDYYDEG